MYKDNSLIPSEAIRLAALGLLWQGERNYADLAREIRHFVARIAGPSLELLGPSLELFKVEGLIEVVDATLTQDTQIMRLTQEGAIELRRLMTTRFRGPMGEINKLIIALKMHFFDSLKSEEQQDQLDLMIEACNKELARLSDLKLYHPLTSHGGHLSSWLDLEIDEITARQTWFETLRNQIGLK